MSDRKSLLQKVHTDLLDSIFDDFSEEYRQKLIEHFDDVEELFDEKELLEQKNEALEDDVKDLQSQLEAEREKSKEFEARNGVLQQHLLNLQNNMAGYQQAVFDFGFGMTGAKRV